MGIVKSGKTSFQAYARLISVLGDQLISDKWIGVNELVKNSYDADAEEVKVRFINFDNTGPTRKPTIEIEDDGIGMDLGTILDVWMKPATPNKLNKKKSKSDEKRFTKKGRVMQGDKGVGRFAIYKLGDFVEVFTKTKNENEIKLTLNFHEYASDEFEETQHEDKFLDQIENDWEVHDTPERIVNGKNQGTIIRITDIRNEWKYTDLEKLSKAFFRMMPPTLPGVKVDKDFKVDLSWNGVSYVGNFMTFEQMADLAPYYFEGTVDSHGHIDASYRQNTNKTPISFNPFTDRDQGLSYDIYKLKFFKERFVTNTAEGGIESIRTPQVGGFMFFFYGYDWRNPTEGLKETERAFLRETSVYLYRDNVRVYPYGEIGDDWLMLSKYRAEDRAGHYFSYNDLIGFVFITQTDNPKLRDAADREGLMNINGTKDDFVALIQAVLKVMKDNVEIQKRKKEIAQQKVALNFGQQYESAFKSLQKRAQSFNDPELLDTANKFYSATNNLVQKYREDLKITQELAGTGMAVEKATHDTMSLLKQLKSNTETFVARFDNSKISTKELRDFLLELQENLEFLYQELQVLQPLFRVARKVTKDVSVASVAERVTKYFRRELEGKIQVSISPKKDVTVKTNTGLILQVLLNLMDNSIYWLSQQNTKYKEIKIEIDPNERTIIFADSGPGIDANTRELVFTEFYTRKADGRGLGLYIVKELLDRIDAEISVITEPKLKILKGANFLIKFKKDPK